MSVRRLKALMDKLFSPKYLLVTNTALGVTFITAGDAISQTLTAYAEKEKKEFDRKRNASMMGGGLFFGVIGHYWYSFLDNRFPGRSRATVIKKLGLELAVGPPFALGLFLTVGSFEGKTIQKCLKDFKDNLLLICAGDWFFYVPLQSLNFYLLPPKYRFLYVACITLVYDTFISYVLHKNDEVKGKQKER